MTTRIVKNEAYSWVGEAQNTKRAKAFEDVLCHLAQRRCDADQVRTTAITGMTLAAIFGLADWFWGPGLYAVCAILFVIGAVYFIASDATRRSLKGVELRTIESGEQAGFKIRADVSRSGRSTTYYVSLDMPHQRFHEVDDVGERTSASVGASEAGDALKMDDKDIGELESKSRLVWRPEESEQMIDQLLTGDQDKRRPNLHPCPPDHCDLCKGDIGSTGWFVDGETRRGAWANMCTDCYRDHGSGVGWGLGQLYWAIGDCEYRLMAGGNPSEVEDE